MYFTVLNWFLKYSFWFKNGQINKFSNIYCKREIEKKSLSFEKHKFNQLNFE